ncbi:MAG: hypothetical protein RMI91_01820 [Gemmatales bacterium]|nr:hypothetical protein [Gemmatales bacterium]MDW7993364.1 hypothetical protein [Gemmatales bacterium]
MSKPKRLKSHNVRVSGQESRKRSVGRLGRLPAVPTAALPGTPGKIEVMAQRAARGESLFHPQDATLDGEWALIIKPSPTGRPIVIGQVNQRTKAVRIWPRKLCSAE